MDIERTILVKSARQFGCDHAQEYQLWSKREQATRKRIVPYRSYERIASLDADTPDSRTWRCLRGLVYEVVSLFFRKRDSVKLRAIPPRWSSSENPVCDELQEYVTPLQHSAVAQ